MMLLGLFFAAAKLIGFHIEFMHVKFGVEAIFFACWKPFNAYLRTKKVVAGDQSSSKIILWEYWHVATGRSALVIGIIALISGMRQLGDRYGGENVRGIN